MSKLWQWRTKITYPVQWEVCEIEKFLISGSTICICDTTLPNTGYIIYDDLTLVLVMPQFYIEITQDTLLFVVENSKHSCFSFTESL